MPSIVEVWRDTLSMTLRVSIHYQREPGDTVYSVSHMVSEETLFYQPDITAFHTADVLVNYLRAKLHIGPWDELRLKIATILVYGPMQDLAPPRAQVVDNTYRDAATSEFEGVEELDPSLWNQNGDLL